MFAKTHIAQAIQYLLCEKLADLRMMLLLSSRELKIP